MRQEPIWHKTHKLADSTLKCNVDIKEDFRAHDLRHTFASWHAQAGTPLSVLQELGGWRSPVMVQRYAHLTAGQLVNYANNIVQDTSSTKLAHMPITKVEN
jgi:integrase